jgi:hypothetical protein
MKKQIYALYNLAWYWWLHVFKMPFRRFRKQSGMEAFLNNFKEDNIKGIGIKESGELPSYEGCINCGICSFHFKPAGDPFSKVTRDALSAPDALPVSFSRSLPEIKYSLDSMESYEKLQVPDFVCPNGVPFERLRVFVLEQAKF